MSSGPSTSRRSQTIFCGLIGNPVSFGVLRAVGGDRLAHGLERRRALRLRAQCQRTKRGGDVSEHADRHDVVRVDFGGERVDVDDGLVAIGIPHVGVVLDHVVADADDHVGLLEREPRQVPRLQADRSERQLIGERHHALGHEGVGHRDPQHLGEGHQRIGRTLADHAVAGEDHRRLGRRDQLRGLFDLVARSFGRVRRLNLDRLLVRDHLGDVLGEVDEGGTGLFRLRHLERLANDLGHDARLEDLRRILRDRIEHAHEIQDLVALLVQTGRGALSGNRHDRRAIHVRVGDAGDEVCRPGTQGGHAHPSAPGQATVHVSHERGALLVVRGDELDGTVQQCIHHVDVFFAGNAEDVLDTFVLQALDEQFSGFHSGSSRVFAAVISRS